MLKKILRLLCYFLEFLRLSINSEKDVNVKMRRVSRDIDAMIETLRRRESRAIAKFKPIYQRRIEELQKLKGHCPISTQKQIEESDPLQLMP